MRPADLRPYRHPTLHWFVDKIWRLEHAFERAKAKRREQDTPYRIFFVLALFGAAFLTLAVGATTKVLFSGHGRSGAFSGVVEPRADLVDRQGRLLAVDLAHFGVYLDPREVWDRDEILRKLPAALPGLQPGRLEHALRSERRTYLQGGLTPEEKARVHDLGLPGISFEEEDRRVYPLGSTAAHLIGFVDKGGQGLSGAELGLDDLIREEGAQGRPVPLSIDLRIQAVLDDEVKRAAVGFEAIGAVGLVVDTHTGEILAMTSYPDFDPNDAGHAQQSQLTNHVAATVYEPGSVFKVFTVALGLDSGVANVNTMLDARTPLTLGGQTIHDYDKDNAMLPLWEVFTHSSNIGAARLGLLAGGDRMDKFFHGLGLFAAAPSELAESARPITPRRFDENSIASMSFGHAISVSPLAIATGMVAVLNGGEYIPLTIRKLDPSERPQGRRVLSERTSRAMLDLMRLNVLKGTGGKANAQGLRVGGKTGSAEKALGGHYVRNKLVSSFAAVFPTDGPMNAPRYFVLIMMDEPHGNASTGGFATGGWTSAPVAGRVIDRIAPFLGVKRAPLSAADQAVMAGATPAQLNGEER